MKIGNKITFYSSIWLLAILFLVNSLIYLLFIKITTDNEIDTLRRKAEFIMQKVPPHVIMQKGQESLLQDLLPENSMVRVIDTQSKIVNLLYNDEDVATISPAFVTQYENERYRKKEYVLLTVRLPISESGKSIGTLEIAEKLVSLQNNVNLLISILIFSSAGALLLCVVGGKFLSRIILEPIQNMNQTMKEIEDSLDFKKITLPRNSQDELYKMTDTFNHMMDRIEESFLKQQQFVWDASHELKTTITIIESYANMLRRWGIENEALRREAVDAIYEESIRMKNMTQQMLDLASLEKVHEVSLEPLELVSVCLQKAKLLMKLHKRTIEVISADEKITLVADPMKIGQLLLILLDNALKYSKADVEIHLSQQLDTVTIRVHDYGIGIPANELENVFERFYRVDKARDRKTGGTGLGLPIARAIVLQHHGKIYIHSRENEGTEITILLPKLQELGGLDS